ncbi:tetratricopeptide repeat protein [Roseofilum sp. Guam]|uniref:tetratricopeptide repeat protein n=1 Tax=Roseofilum sp. Guam TaxID=2821502 RepID=UPI001B135C75|nr:tetratricopeptide repeat protein [Roseofilum sp. Guam]MBP0031119.1 tetratricopeptide repeat protein [Roseofilum sp. Guam]
MFRKIQRWLEQLWQWFKGLWSSSSSSSADTATTWPTDTDYEMRFMSFLEGIYQGKSQVLKDWENLQQEYSEDQWIAWLKRFGQKVTQNSEPNEKLAQRLIRLGEVGCGQLGEVAKEIGEQLHPPISLDEDNPQVWFDRGKQLLDEEDQKALEAFDRTLELYPNHYRAAINRGNALMNLGKHQEAILAYDHALELNPDADLAWANRGNVFFDLEDYEQAIANWDRAIELNPKDLETWHNKGIVLGVKLNRFEEALTCFDQTLALQADDVQAWFHRGIVLAALNRWEDALESWNQVTDLQPDFQDAWINKGVALQKLGRYAEAIAANQRAINPS